MKSASEVIREAKQHSIWALLWLHRYHDDPTYWARVKRKQKWLENIIRSGSLFATLVLSTAVYLLTHKPACWLATAGITFFICTLIYYVYVKTRDDIGEKPEYVETYEKALRKLDDAMFRLNDEGGGQSWWGLGEPENTEAAKEYVTEYLMQFARQTCNAQGRKKKSLGDWFRSCFENLYEAAKPFGLVESSWDPYFEKFEKEIN
jgi:hypothetical protein